MTRSRRWPPFPLVLLALLSSGGGLGAQEGNHRHGEDARSWGVGAQAVPLLTHATPAVDGESRTEAYLTQPALMGHLSLLRGRVELLGMLNLEGLTLRRGELNAGIWGEGYVDRRHPHTYLHEAMVVAYPIARDRGTDLSLAVGKGFVPFGTDDPMSRPFVKYPANHHLAQILERAVVIATARRGPVALEAALFNGDEPQGPGDAPNLDRFGDSWAVRGTLFPGRGVEASASHAWVTSPEHPTGGLFDQRKWSAAARWERGDGHRRRGYALLEWARTEEHLDGRRIFTFPTLLAEGALRRRGVQVAGRWERTDRPEGERLLDPFRAPVPHHDLSILGITRWEIWTLAASLGAPAPAGLCLRPFAEISRLRARNTIDRSFFIPAEFYGSERMWSLSAGIRVQAGVQHERMGRYGAALSGMAAHH